MITALPLKNNTPGPEGEAKVVLTGYFGAMIEKKTENIPTSGN